MRNHISIVRLISAPSAVLASILFAALLAGCDRDRDVKVYRLAKDSSTQAPNSGMGSGEMSVPAQIPAGTAPFTWALPAGWEELPPSQMRVASFLIKGQDKKQADVSVIPLGGVAGGDFANVNRWRGQVGLQPVAEDELKKFSQPVPVGAEAADLYEMAGKNGSSEPTRILAAILHREGTAWFFKMTGDDQLVAQQKSQFVAFLKSIQFQSANVAGLPASHPPIDNLSMPSGPAAEAPSSGDAKPAWTPPSDWREVSGGQFLVAKFLIGEGASLAAVNVSASAGDGGGLAANVNRWRKQLGLEEVPAADANGMATPIELSGGKAMLVQVQGTDARSGQPASLVGAIVPQPGQTWFYKLMGDSKVVEAQKAAFTGFIKSVKY